MAYYNADQANSSLVKLELACSDLKILLKDSAKMEESLGKMDKKFDLIEEALSTASKRVAPLQSSAIAAKALETRINRAVSPALALLDSFKLSDSLQDRITELYDELSVEKTRNKILKKMIKYVDCVDQLNAAINTISEEGEPVIQRLQEVAEFLSRTKAADQQRTHRLRETVITLKALYETEVDQMRFEGSLDQALRTYTPEEIDDMDWESLETAIALWIQHFELAVKTVFVSEKKLCSQVLGGVMEGLVWPECFAKIADKIMAVFFRFGEGITRSSKEPQKLFKLLDMFDSLEKLKPQFSDVFDGESGADICSRFRELIKLLIHASSKVYWEFGLQIEGDSDGSPSPQDGSVPKLVRYAINYLKYLATEDYSASMEKVLQTEQIWKSGALSKPETDENLFRDAISNVMEALQRNVEAKRGRYRDKQILSHVFAMNTYWYVYMRTRNTELGKLLGDQYMKKKYKAVAEESAYLYQKQAWGNLVTALDKEDLKEGESREEMRKLVREKVEAFTTGFDDILQRHRGVYAIPDGDLREQMREATVKLVVSAYREFVNSFSTTLRGRSFLSPEAIEGRLNKFFDAMGGKVNRRDYFADRTGQRSSTSAEAEIRGFQRSRSRTSDV